MRFVYLMALTLLALAGCTDSTTPACSTYTTSTSCPSACTWTGSICQAKPTQCSDIKDATFCSVYDFTNSNGCYWTGTACAAATTCTQPTEQVSCVGTTVGGTACFWSGSACLASPTTPPTAATCTLQTTKPTCQTANCFWNGTGCVQTLSVCSDIKDETLCNEQAIVGGGCFWSPAGTLSTAGGTCAQATACYQPHTETGCLGTHQNSEQCSWSGTGCYLNSTSGAICPTITAQATCNATRGSGNFCFWKGTTCQAAQYCIDLTSAPLCMNAPLKSGGGNCTWTPSGSATCSRNSMVDCTLNTASTACCAGNNTDCSSTDLNCVFTAATATIAASCQTSTTAACTLNSGSPFSSLANMACCASGTAANNTCTATNDNCTYVPAGGSCGG